MFSAGLAAHLRYRRAEALAEYADYDVALADRHVFVNGALRTFLVGTGTDIGFPPDHSEFDIAFGRHIAVEARDDVGDVLPLSGDVPRRSDEQCDDPDH